MHGRPGQNAEDFALLIADIYDVAGMLRRHGDQVAATYSQTQTRWQLLSVISEDYWTVPLAADRLGTSRQAVQRVANELVKDGLAVFSKNPRHRRSPFLRPTPQGRSTLHAITAAVRERNRAILERLGDLKISETRAALRLLAVEVRSELDADGTRGTSRVEESDRDQS